MRPETRSTTQPISADPAERRTALYRRLLDTGWLIERRERYGISYVMVSTRSIDVFAPVVARLAGT